MLPGNCYLRQRKRHQYDAQQASGIRAALCWTAEIAHLARQHNDANVLVMPGRFIGTEEADMIMTEFFNTSFEADATSGE